MARKKKTEEKPEVINEVEASEVVVTDIENDTVTEEVKEEPKVEDGNIDVPINETVVETVEEVPEVKKEKTEKPKAAKKEKKEAKKEVKKEIPTVVVDIPIQYVEAVDTLLNNVAAGKFNVNLVNGEVTVTSDYVTSEEIVDAIYAIGLRVK